MTLSCQTDLCIVRTEITKKNSVIHLEINLISWHDHRVCLNNVTFGQISCNKCEEAGRNFFISWYIAKANELILILTFLRSLQNTFILYLLWIAYTWEGLSLLSSNYIGYESPNIMSLDMEVWQTIGFAAAPWGDCTHDISARETAVQMTHCYPTEELVRCILHM
jgi:hypothetical protein